MNRVVPVLLASALPALTQGFHFGLKAGVPATHYFDTGVAGKRFYPGLALGGGIEFGARRLRVLPEFRYTHWTANIAGPGGVLRFAPNQAEFLVGVLF